MRKFCVLLLGTLLLLGSQAGCGGSKDKGINRDKDKPKPSAKLDPRHSESSGPRVSS
jgi:hypothetical protein